MNSGVLFFNDGVEGSRCVEYFGRVDDFFIVSDDGYEVKYQIEVVEQRRWVVENVVVCEFYVVFDEFGVVDNVVMSEYCSFGKIGCVVGELEVVNKVRKYFVFSMMKVFGIYFGFLGEKFFVDWVIFGIIVKDYNFGVSCFGSKLCEQWVLIEMVNFFGGEENFVFWIVVSIMVIIYQS